MTNCFSTSWAMLIYFPNPEVPKGMMSEFSRWYVQQNLYTDALFKLENYLNILNYIGIEKAIDKYRDSCPQFFTESDRETGVYKEYCHPEKEVYCEVSNRSEQTLPEARYPQQTNAQQEDAGKDTGDKGTKNTDKSGDDDVVMDKKGYTSDMNDVDQIREAGAEEEGCEISTLLEETPQEHPHTQEVTTNKKKVSSPNVTIEPCKEKQENAEIVRVVPDHEEDTANDIVTDEDEIDAPGTRASDCTNILEISTKEHEPSTRKTRKTEYQLLRIKI